MELGWELVRHCAMPSDEVGLFGRIGLEIEEFTVECAALRTLWEVGRLSDVNARRRVPWALLVSQSYKVEGSVSCH